VRGFSRKNAVAMALGAVLAGTPLLVFDHWIGELGKREIVADAAMAASRAVQLADGRVGKVIVALDELAAAGVDDCSSEHVKAMRLKTFGLAVVKGIALLGADHRLLCQQPGQYDGPRSVLASEPLHGRDDYFLDVMRFGNGATMVRLRRRSKDGAPVLASIMPSELLVPMLTETGPYGAHVKMMTAGGSLIGESGHARPLEGVPVATANRVSDKYHFKVTSVLPISLASRPDLAWLGMSLKLALATVLIGCTLLIPRRSGDNPAAELERALDAGEFVPYYQPIVDIRSGQLRGAEVLVRWRKSDGTLVLPGAFIPLAESSGLILPLTRNLMRRVAAEAGAAIGSRPGLKISFNFAAQLFDNESIVKDVRNAFANSAIDLSQVVLELTEHDPIENLAETRRVIAALQGIGVRIAIDDVGTGHSGLSYMLKLGVDIIKIDKMFVDAIGSDRNSETIIETLVDLAHNMRMDIVAEGVETFEQVMRLREFGVRSAQGYVFAPPLPGGAFLELVEAIDPLPAASVAGKVAGAARRYMSARSNFRVAS
jgi:sensor c-di-GMP phosphodiesterase-like protein